MKTSLHWVTSADGIAIAIAYRESEPVKIYPLISQYSYFLAAAKKKKPLTVSADVRAIFSFLRFLETRRRLVTSVDDKLLESFKKDQRERVEGNKISRHDKFAWDRTVNAKLRSVYWFLWWCQYHLYPNLNLIGPVGCFVTSSLHSGSWKGSRKGKVEQGFKTRYIQHDERFPLCEDRVGSSSIYSYQQVPTEDDLEKIEEHMFKDGVDFESLRNVLYLKIGQITGFRRESMVRLRISQFSEEVIVKAKEKAIKVLPDVQKNSYRFTYDVPLELAYQILHFVEAFYKPYYEHYRWPLSRGGGYLFTSASTGRPLSPGCFTRIFSDEFKRLNAGKGAAVHILRHHFTHTAIVEEIKKRLANGMDTSLIDVCRAVSLKLGHKNEESIRSYVSGVISEMLGEISASSPKHL